LTSLFTVRVELHRASGADYDTLHDRMYQAGFKRYIRGHTPTGEAAAWALPTAEYDHTSDLPATAVRDRVMVIAQSVQAAPAPWVLVTQVATRAWSTAKLDTAKAA
jgi:hypothetical protein